MNIAGTYRYKFMSVHEAETIAISARSDLIIDQKQLVTDHYN